MNQHCTVKKLMMPESSHFCAEKTEILYPWCWIDLIDCYVLYEIEVDCFVCKLGVNEVKKARDSTTNYSSFHTFELLVVI